MKFRKLTLVILGGLISAGMAAESYQINLQSTRQLGMGHLGTALKLGGESMFFNPAGMAYMENKTDFSFGVNGILSKVKYSTGTSSTYTQNPLGTPIFGYYGMKLTDNLAVGISVTNPAGNSLNWGDNWPGATLVQKIKLESFTIQPTLSYKISDKLSVGVGLMVDFGSFELNKALIPAGGLAGVASAVPSLAPVINYYKSNSAVSLALKGDTKTALGYNLGILYNPSEKFSIGVTYRSKVVMKVQDGKTSLLYPGTAMSNVIATAASVPALASTFTPILMLGNTGFSVDLPLPSELKVGVAFKGSDKFTTSAEVDYVGWSAYKALTFDFTNEALPTSVAQKNFKNTFIYRLGAEYKSTDKVTARIGFIYDTTPVDLNLYGPETPGANKFSFTTGFTFNPCKNMGIDVAMQFLKGQKTDGSVPMGTGTFKGQYTSIALIPSLGLSFKF